jgi:transposase
MSRQRLPRVRIRYGYSRRRHPPRDILAREKDESAAAQETNLDLRPPRSVRVARANEKGYTCTGERRAVGLRFHARTAITIIYHAFVLFVRTQVSLTPSRRASGAGLCDSKVAARTSRIRFQRVFNAVRVVVSNLLNYDYSHEVSGT